MSADLHHLSAAYALDALDDVERQQFESHYPTCEICSADVQDFRTVAAALATSAASAAPASLKSSVMAEIGQTRQLSPIVTQQAPSSRSNLFSGRALMAVAAAMILVAGVLAVTLPGSGEPSFNEVAESADRVVTSLDPVVDGQAGDLQIVWSDELDSVAVIGSSLDDPGSGMAYALWFLIDEGVAPAGLFVPENGSVSTSFAIDDIDTNGWGITIEPAGGSDQPTTPVLFAGTL